MSQPGGPGAAPPPGGAIVGQGPYRGAPQAKPHRSGLILGLGIASIVVPIICFFCCMPFAAVGLGLGIPALVMAKRDLQQMRAGTMDPTGHDQTNIGMVLGIIGTSIAAVALVVTVVLVVLYGGLIGLAALGGAMQQ